MSDEKRFTAADLEAAWRDGWKNGMDIGFASEHGREHSWDQSTTKQKIDGC